MEESGAVFKVAAPFQAAGPGPGLSGIEQTPGMNFHTSVRAEGFFLMMVHTRASLEARSTRDAMKYLLIFLVEQRGSLWLAKSSFSAETLLSSQQMAETIARLQAMPRLGSPENIARMAGFLLSPDADWITGQIISVDGGRSTLRTKG